jgi:hypothetical protein
MSIRPSLSGESGLRVVPELFKNRAVQLATETVDSLQSIWKEAGYEDIECQSLLGDLLNKLKMTCASELAAEQQILEHAKQQVTTKLFEYTDYCAQLGRPPPPAGVPHGANYTDKLAELEKLLSSISGEVSQRQKLLNTEMTAIDELVSVLGETPPGEAAFSGPSGTPHLSDIRLELMRAFKKKLLLVRNERTAEVNEIAALCAQNMNDLVIADEGTDSMANAELYKECDAALLQFAKSGSSGVLKISLHENSIALLKERCECLQQEKERRREELAKSGAEIARLWTLLRIPQEEREAFQNSFKMNLSLETLAKGRKELERLNLVRSESLGRVVSSIRADIVGLWEEAGVETEEQRSAEFPEFYSSLEMLDDSAVDVHEAYYSSLRARVEELRPLLSEIQRRETISQERVELEHLQMNPERLSARGPHAREERKREEGMNTRVRNLEKITKKVLNLISKWEENNGPFYFAGERYPDRVAQQEQDYQDIKAELRNSRKRKDDKPGPGGKLPNKRASVTAPVNAKVSSSGYGQARPANKENHTVFNATNTSTDSAINKLVHHDRRSVGSDSSDVTEIRDASRGLSNF